MNVFEKVEKNINNLVENNVYWSTCAPPEELQKAREGQLTLKFFDKEIPSEWLKNIKGKKVLCLAGAGGLQAPLLACAGAEVTVFDLSERLLSCFKKGRRIYHDGTESNQLSM